MDRLTTWLAAHKPDVVCLQEIKADAQDFPWEQLKALGYHVEANCQRTYNGVSILSLSPMTQVTMNLDDGVDDPQARLLAATVDGVRVVNVYVPNGSEVGCDKYAYKLAWLARLRTWLDAHATPGEPLALCGDFNVALEARDVHDPAFWAQETLFHQDSVKALERVVAFGLKDSLRLHTQDAGIYTWWDYRMLGFPKNRGLRIDHIFLTPTLAARCTGVEVDRNERKGKLPSDHAPVTALLL